MTDDLKSFEKAPEADTPQTEDPTTLEMPTDDLEADIEPGKPDDDFERMLAQAGALSSAKVPEGFRCCRGGTPQCRQIDAHQRHCG